MVQTFYSVLNDFTGFAIAVLILCKQIVAKVNKSNTTGGTTNINQLSLIWNA